VRHIGLPYLQGFFVINRKKLQQMKLIIALSFIVCLIAFKILRAMYIGGKAAYHHVNSAPTDIALPDSLDHLDRVHARFSPLMLRFCQQICIPVALGVPAQVANVALTIADITHQIAGQDAEIKDSTLLNKLASSIVAIQGVHAVSRAAGGNVLTDHEKQLIMENLELKLIGLTDGAKLTEVQEECLTAIAEAYRFLSSLGLEALRALDQAIGEFFLYPGEDPEGKLKRIVWARASVYLCLQAHPEKFSGNLPNATMPRVEFNGAIPKYY
jgi:hypothetical protein